MQLHNALAGHEVFPVKMKMKTKESQAVEALFSIPNKLGVKVPFLLNESQAAYDQMRSKRDIIPKARQKGMSSFGIALQVVDCLGKEGTRAVLISHEAKATQRLLDKARFYLEHMQGPKAVLGRHSRNEFYFPKTESTLYIGTAGAKAFGRGDTITHLHISEYAWWEGIALRQVAGLFQAVPLGGTIRIESTGNGRNNDFYYMCMNAAQLGYETFFRSWHDDLEYQLSPPEQWVPEGFEHYFQDMKLLYQLNEAQLYWYWVKLLEFRQDLSLMQQEYPSSLDECFKATGGAIFSNLTRVKTDYWKFRVEKSRRLEYLEGHPMKERTYVIGADPSGGTGNDEAGVQVLCIETLEQVFEFGSNRIDPVDFAYFLLDLGKTYNEAYIICEANNHGIATHSVLTKNYNKMKIYKRNVPRKGLGKILYGFITSESSKPLLIGAIKELDDMGLSVYGLKTYMELQAFEEAPDGTMGAQEDGLVIALGLACVGVQKWLSRAFDISVKPKEKKQDLSNANFMYFTFEEVMDNLSKKTQQPFKGFPRMLQ